MPHSARQRAIITGASSGIGEEFAMQLAPVMDEIVLIARRKERLEEIAETLRRINPELQVYPYEADLTDGASLLGFIDQALEMPAAETLLINNAGLGDYGEFSTAEWDRLENMLVLNMLTLTKLTHSLLPFMLEHGGGIINISSLASSLPIPDFAIYAATKSYVLSFSEALRIELKGTGINVLAVCPGPVSTEFGKVARREGFTGNMMPGRNFFDTPKEVVVAQSIKALARGKARIYPGIITRISAFVLALLPMPVIRLVMGRRFRRSIPIEE